MEIAKYYMHMLRTILVGVFGIWFVTPTFAVHPKRI